MSKSDRGMLRDRVDERWAAAEYDIQNVEEWGDVDGWHTIEDLAPERLSSHGQGNVAGWAVEDDDLLTRCLAVEYCPDGVHFCFQGDGADVEIDGGATLTPEQAKRLGAALFQAGEELDRWRDAAEGQ